METLQRAANAGSVSTGYDIENSLKLEINNNEWIYRASPTAGNKKTFTFSLWLKRPCLYHIPAGADEYLMGQGANARYHFAGDTIRFMFDGNTTELESSRKIRDPAAWYHIVLAVDTTQGTAANRVKLYINGVQEAWNNAEYPSLNQESSWMSTNNLYIGTKYAGDGDNDLAGYIAEVVLLDGTATSPTDFGEFDSDSGIWKPIDVSGLTFGDEGFYYKFDDAASLGADSSGNSNNATLNNITAADQALDSPTNNYCTLLSTSPSNSYYKRVTNGGTSYDSVTNAWTSCWSTIPLYSGKWYAEFKRTSAGTGGNIFVGAGGIDQNLYHYNLIYVGANGSGTTFSVGLFSVNGDFYSGTGVTGSTYAAGDILCLAVDQDNGAIYFRKNGDAWMGDGTNAGNPASGASRTGAQIIDWGTATNIAISNYANNDETQANYGGYSCMSNTRSYSDGNGYGAFVYEPPTDYLAICSKNLAETG
tara:strand:- start:1594 stop:3024 length:1431 start_codon:yes stop_codon:yes gene_type:complete